MTGTYPRALLAGDLNGDGRLDLAVANFGMASDGSLSVLTGNGDGSFQPPLNRPWNGNPTSLAAADFNGDGALDLVASSRNNSLAVLLGGMRPATAITLTGSVSAAEIYQPVILTAAIAPADATGPVTFFDGATTLGANSIVNGQATLTVRFSAVGVHTITARYAGSGVYAGITSAAIG